MAKVLLVDDDPEFLSATTQLLELLGHRTETAESLAQAQSLLHSDAYDHVLLDLLLPDGSGLHLLKDIEQMKDRPIKATLITGHSIVRELMGSFDQNKFSFLVKPIDLEKLKSLFPEEEHDTQDAQTEYVRHFGCLIGESKIMRNLYEVVDKVSKTKANVLLMGESGTGKEVFAQAVHNASQTAGKFTAVNCGAFSKDLLSSELFGHEKGAFTGAVARKKGVFEQSHNGTLFLDEITEMPLDEQVSLLRALETRSITRIGSTESIAIDCRVVSATNRTESQLAEGDCLREDLYYRLAVFPIQIPPLRDRKDDIPLLVRCFLHDLNQENATQYEIDDRDLEYLQSYDWPGNVRELRHAVHRAYILSDSSQGTLVLPKTLGSPFSKSDGVQRRALFGRTIENVEKELILTTLEQLDNNKQKAAKVLGVSLKTLYNRLNAYEKERNAE